MHASGYAIILVLGLGVGVIGLISPTIGILSVVVVPILIVFGTQPSLAVLLIVGTIATVFYDDTLPLFPIGVGSLQFTDVILLFLFLTILLKSNYVPGADLVRTPLDIPLALFILAALISVYVAMSSSSVDFNTSMRMFRCVFYYSLCFVVVNLIRDRKQFQFMIFGLFIIACLTALAMALQAALGDKITILPGRVELANTFNHTDGAIRVLPPGQTLVYVMFITSLSLVIFGNSRTSFPLGYWVVVICLSLGMLVSFNRSYWVGAITSIITLYLMAPTDKRRRIYGIVGSGVGTILLGVIVSVAVGGKMMATLSAASERFDSLFTGEQLIQSNSLKLRYLENESAVRTIAKNPIFGVGLGANYRDNNLYAEYDTNREEWMDDPIKWYIHNGYLWIIVKMGFVGFLPFILFWTISLVRGIRYSRELHDPLFTACASGFVAANLSMLAIAMVNPVFMQWFSIVVIGVTMGLTESIFRMDKKMKKSESTLVGT